MNQESHRNLNIVERPLIKQKPEKTVLSLSAFAYLYSELIQYNIDKSANTTELEERLDKVGYEIGLRINELLSCREKTLRRRTEILDILKFIHSTVWPAFFGKNADDLQQAAAAEDEYMISDYDMKFTKFISVPRSYGSFNPGALVAGIVRGVLDSAGFPARVSAHTVEDRERSRKPITTILVKFHSVVMTRQLYIEKVKKG
mmetsp:Transcript_2813/g.4425  ORF Transcript_2813/g.4425 Transcript_2813/m.4425 type:complete len:202 (-) Transcript_2813:152-757(-)|eukprot:CAMPEP_0175045570 /NCGR_PEP_ID=MMETSP0052_2-20121109/4505_1 /TAXON_ID=51329 ORGANISM="Polytomella parva, Strain SAG 63-3" /NCGR_SAMPLE_ID=MMETSP0052_2 /ASSEMBLY_ACC=CAM_ASM_000194 /LENGTH=201 /DNA_ID=CAMNT_0016309133 /DNA_START=109 /DNA_END=714 /DNA_ORIENTATION=+